MFCISKVLKTTFSLALLSLPLASASVLAKEIDIRLPTGEQWLEHVTQGLQPYWMMESAQGTPKGNFPTFRCDDGRLLVIQNPCSELSKSWITPHFGREYTRMKSRQIYGYSVLYNLTGNTEALALAKAGVDYLLAHHRDKQHGGFYSFLQDGKPGLKWTQRTAQDQAYAIVGLAAYYYITRDPKVQQALIEQQRFIFEHYKSEKFNDLVWVMEDGDNQSHKQRELVAQLDQINGYLLLVAPLMPEPVQKKWNADLEWLTNQMVKQYHNEEEQRFYGAIHSPDAKKQNARHNDYGHTIKAYWMTYLVGRYLYQPEWEILGDQGMMVTLERAKHKQDKKRVDSLLSDKLKEQWQGLDAYPTWKSGPSNGYSSSWQWAELDQAAMMMSASEQSLDNQLYYTLNLFMDGWVDHKHGGVGLDPKRTKAFHWGNAYHQFEHALVGYITAQKRYRKPVRLYFAFPSDYKGLVQPYYFRGDISSMQEKKTKQGLTIQAVEFTNISPFN